MRPEAFVAVEHLQLRKSGISGTDIAAIAGLSPWRTAFDVWCEKKGLVDPLPPTVRQRVGLAVEPVIRDLYQLLTGCTLADKSCVRHPEQLWMVGEIDGYVTPTAEDRGVEYKNVSLWSQSNDPLEQWGPEGTDQVPAVHLVQAAWYQAITDTHWWDITRLHQERLQVYTLTRDLELEGQLLEVAQRFRRDYLEADQAPPVTRVTDVSRAYLRQRYATHDSDLIDAPFEAEKLLEERTLVKDVHRLATTELEAVEFSLKECCGDHAGLRFADGTRVTWKKTRDAEIVDWKALAHALHPSPDQLQLYTRTRPGTRRFLVRTGTGAAEEEEDT